MKKGWVIGCGIGGAMILLCGGGVAALVLFVFNAISTFAKPADEFLTKLGSGDTTGAYQAGASGLRAAQTQEEFDASVKKLRLDQFKSASWNKFDMKNNQATLEGTATLTDGSTMPLTVDLVNEGGWKVLGVKPQTGGVSGDGGKRLTVPPEDELKSLANRDMSLFHKAVASDDFTTFHDSLAKPFQKEKTAGELREAFKVFIEKMIDLSPVETVAPELTKPATIDGDGVLEVAGKYPSRPATIQFTLRYMSEKGEWKLVGVDVQTKAAE